MLRRVIYGDYEIEVDPEVNADLYRRIKASSDYRCTCCFCINLHEIFKSIDEFSYLERYKNLASELGIDLHTPDEVTYYASGSDEDLDRIIGKYIYYSIFYLLKGQIINKPINKTENLDIEAVYEARKLIIEQPGFEPLDYLPKLNLELALYEDINPRSITDEAEKKGMISLGVEVWLPLVKLKS